MIRCEPLSAPFPCITGILQRIGTVLSMQSTIKRVESRQNLPYYTQNSLFDRSANYLRQTAMALPKTDNPLRELVRPGSSTGRYDFRVDADTVEWQLSRKRYATDEMLLEAVGWFEPPLLDAEMLALVRRELDPNAKRSGRPRTRTVSLKGAAKHIERSQRDDLPPRFRAHLVERLRSRVRVTDKKRAIRFHREYEKRAFADLATFLYRQFRILIERDTTQIYFGPLGHLMVGNADLTPSKRAMILVRKVLDDHLQMDPPSEERLRNIISENSRYSS